MSGTRPTDSDSDTQAESADLESRLILQDFLAQLAANGHRFELVLHKCLFTLTQG